ncbi:phage terminase small subunit P27 family [Isoptericola dokdonensis]|uniref:Phage terminase, small subunit n=1 Tax=Isoptericola dokdonensis DS-3 TaxID=1300344 RepID=A0A168FDI5_9MICO|nr:phage terminase small subunit P27 family [Isoptericola dokdonensis]ANC31441.1 Phage terminase, small subunit [Isoptericola dokdonensis DS-3]
MAQQAATGRKQQPAALRILHGGRDAAGNPVDSGGRPIAPTRDFTRRAPDKPSDLSDDASWIWDLITSELEHVELLKPLDGGSLRVACETYARWKEAVRFRLERGLLSKNSQGVVTAPWVGIEERASKDFRAWCAEFGLTPAAEGKMPGAANAENENPFD